MHFFAVTFLAHLLISQLYQQLCWSHSVTKWGVNELMNLPASGNSSECNQSQHAEMSFSVNYCLLIDGVFLRLSLREGPAISDLNNAQFKYRCIYLNINRGVGVWGVAGTILPSRMGTLGIHEPLIAERWWPSSSPLCSLSILPSVVNKIYQELLGEDLAFSHRLVVMMVFSWQDSLESCCRISQCRLGSDDAMLFQQKCFFWERSGFLT